MATSLHLPYLTGGEEFMLLKRIPKHLLVLSTMLKSTVSKTRSLGTKETALKLFVMSSQNLANIVLSSPVPHGEVSRNRHSVSSKPLNISRPWI